MRREIRLADLSARTGGEECCLVLAGTGQEAGRLIAGRLREALEGLRIPGCPELRVTARFGVSAVRGGEKSLALAITRAAATRPWSTWGIEGQDTRRPSPVVRQAGGRGRKHRVRDAWQTASVRLRPR